MAVTYSVIGLFFLVVFMFLTLIVLRITGARRERNFEGKAEEIRPAVYELLTGDSPAGEVVAELHATIPIQDRRELEYVLLENARVLKGRELEILTMVFEQLGYADEDIATVRHGRDIKKAESAFHLGTMRTPRAVPYLVSALASRSPEVEFSALNALSKIGTPEAIAAVMEYLATHNELETLRVAEIVLERNQAFSPYLEEWLKHGEADIPRLELLIDLMGVMKNAKVVPVLFDYLAHEDPAVRASAASALGGIGDSSASDRLKVALFDDDPGVRAEAATALGKVQCIEAVPLLKGGLSDPDLTVKINSAQALSQLGEEGYAVLEEGLAATEDQERGVVAEVLAVQQIRNGEGG
jgi:HEAT repeat protein